MTLPQPVYADPADTPIIAEQRRLTYTRKKQLVKAASRAHDDPPPPPGLSDCCGSSCDPCVKTLWKEEKNAWLQRWGDQAIETGQDKKAMPGAFDW